MEEKQIRQISVELAEDTGKDMETIRREVRELISYGLSEQEIRRMCSVTFHSKEEPEPQVRVYELPNELEELFIDGR